MSIENLLRKSMLKTALRHLLNHTGKTPDRTARNIRELLELFFSDDVPPSLSYDELLNMIMSHSSEECVSFIISRLS